jgi:hypothetical protein
MNPPDDLTPEQLIGRRVAFRTGPEHAGCWHTRMGVKAGKVLRRVPTLAQKAELLAGEGLAPPEALTEGADVPRLWVKADPCPAFPRGCETAAEPACLLLAEG